MIDDEYCLVPVHRVKPLTDKINDSTYTEETIKELRALCVKGREIQDLIKQYVPDSFYIDNIKTGNPLLFVTLQLCNNMCVENRENQDYMYPLVIPLYSNIQWDLKTATIALSFIITCTQPGSKNRDLLSFDLLEPFLQLPHDNEEFEIRIVALLPSLCTDALNWAMKNHDKCIVMLDRIHDAIECAPEQFNIESVIPLLLQLIEPDRLPVEQSKSKVMALLATLIGCSEPARRKALDLKAVDAIMKTKKIDQTDPILLEWSELAIRYLTGDVDDMVQ